ncbi:MAG TPA: helix-turn-helix domain-containing protein [Thermoleophilaceae bacterium]|nr:helix-turn-helix domain-containing protein [Thermoleophilaceae bacterium]
MPVAGRGESPRPTQALAPRQVAPERRLGAGEDSITTTSRRGGAHGRLTVRRGYHPCLLSWVRGESTDALIERMRQAALRWDRGSLLVSVDRGAQVLLLSEDSPGGPGRGHLREAVRSVVHAVAVRPEAEIRAVVGDRMTSAERLAVVAARLRRLARYAFARETDDVVWARRYSLACMLETLDPRQATAFIKEQLGGLPAYDREHGTTLQRVLELALDHDNRNAAARAAFMHRNTFRRQLSKALELIDVDLACPEERLALHVALKMRALVGPLGSGERFNRAGSDRRLHPASSRAAPSAPRR